MRLINKLCIGCNKNFDAPLSEHNRGKGNYCCKECYKKSIRVIDKTVNCLVCSIGIRVTSLSRVNAKFCSRECYYKKNDLLKNKKCIYCNELIPYKTGYYKRRFCSIRCSARFRNEEKSRLY